MSAGKGMPRVTQSHASWDYILARHQDIGIQHVVSAALYEKQQELTGWKAFESSTGETGTNTAKTEYHKKIERAFAKMFHLAHVFADENEALVFMEEHAHASEDILGVLDRMSNSFLIMKPLLAAVLFCFDLKNAIQSRPDFSKITKAFLSGLIFAGMTLATVAVLASAEVLLKPLFIIQLCVSVVMTCRNIISLWKAGQEKTRNKEALQKNTETLLKYSKLLTEVHTKEITLAQLTAESKEELKPGESRNLAGIHEEMRRLKDEIDHLKSKPSYQEAVEKTDQALAERVELEVERKKLKEKYNECMKDFGLGLSNIFGACLGFFVSSYAGLAVATANICVIMGDFIYKVVRKKINKEPGKTDSKEKYVEHYVNILDKSLEPTKNTTWRKIFAFLSLGTRRSKITEEDSKVLKAVVASRSAAVQVETARPFATSTVLQNLSPHNGTMPITGAGKEQAEEHPRVDQLIAKYRQTHADPNKAYPMKTPAPPPRKWEQPNP